MLQLLQIILPIILLVVFGWLMCWRKIFNDQVGVGLNQFVFYAAIPALIFYAVYKTNIHELLNWPFILAYFTVFMVMFFATFFVYRLFLKRPQGVSTIAGMCASFTNVGLIGLPILLMLVGKKAVLPVAIILIVAMFTYIPMLTMLLESAIGEKQSKNTGIVTTEIIVVNDTTPLASFSKTS